MSTPTLIYCAAGNGRFAELATKHGFKYGAQLPNTIYHAPYFVDQDWKKPDREKYMAALDKYRPALATVLDWEREEQFDEVIAWAQEAAHYVNEAVLIIPKVIGTVDRIPHAINGVPVRLAYSVPTTYGGTSLPTWEFGNRPVHLLGGSPQMQFKLAHYMNVASADANYAQKCALSYGCYFANGTARHASNRYFPRLNESKLGHIEHDAPYMAFELSCINIRAMWLGASCAIRYAVDSDIPAIKQIANQYKNELGYVMHPALRAAITRGELYVAEYGQRVVGFAHWHKRRDGWHTIYEIAVHKDRIGERIGLALLNAVPSPRRLKCTVDNVRANGFYANAGMTLASQEQGRKRALNVWQSAVDGETGK